MFGILCYDSIDEVGHSLFLNFRMGLQNYLKQPLKQVRCVADLDLVTTLFIVDEHHVPCVGVWKNDTFISHLNAKNIKVVVFNFEKIFSSSFPWNVDHQKKLEQINNLFQIVSDIHDAKYLNRSVINKQMLSRDTTLITPKHDKKNEILFIGQINDFYPTRESILRSISSMCKINIVKTDRKLTYAEYLNLVNDYRFILNPLGTGSFINLRFYEAQKLECIVIQQYTDEMLSYYDELTSPNVLIFKDVDEFKKLNFSLEFNRCKVKFIEDYFDEVCLNEIIGNTP